MKNIIQTTLLSIIICFFTLHSAAQFSISAGITVLSAPPMMPDYTQPDCPVDGYLWSPGYWAYDAVDGYYWVPGAWVNPPMPGDYWTPGYWAYENGFYGWNAGYWGLHVGFYGGVNYGYGYSGTGFGGGEWRGNTFNYNTAVVNVNRTVIHNTYINKTVIINNNNHYSFNGNGGINTKPNNQEQMAMHENHSKPTATQINHNQTASHDRSQFASLNGIHPATTAMNKVGGQRFNEQGHKTSPAKAAVNNHSVNPNADHSAVSNNHPVDRESANNHPTPNVNNNHSVNPNAGHGAVSNNHPIDHAPINNHPIPNANSNHTVNPNADHGAVSNNHPVQIHNRPQQNHSPQPVQKKQPTPPQHAEQHAAGEPAHRKD